MKINNIYTRYIKSDIDSCTKLFNLMHERNSLNFPRIERVIFNGPATIVFWQDDTKTVVKCSKGDVFDPEKGIAMAIAKKALGNNCGYYGDIRKWLPKEKKRTCETCKYRPFDYFGFSLRCGLCDDYSQWEPKY